jgi:hypothetical protein
VGKRGPDEATDVDLPHSLRPGAGEQGVLLDEAQRVLDRGLMGPFDDGCNCGFGDRPQRRHRLHRRECQIETGDRLRPGT